MYFSQMPHLTLVTLPRGSETISGREFLRLLPSAGEEWVTGGCLNADERFWLGDLVAREDAWLLQREQGRDLSCTCTSVFSQSLVVF